MMLLFLFVFIVVIFKTRMFDLSLLRKGEFEHKNYSRFDTDTEQYTCQSKFSVFWHKKNAAI